MAVISLNIAGLLNGFAGAQCLGKAAIASGLVAVSLTALASEPYTPVEANEVVATLPNVPDLTDMWQAHWERPDDVTAIQSLAAAHLDYAVSAVDVRGFGASETLLRKSIRQGADDANVWWQLATALKGQHRFDEAAQALEQAVQMDAADPQKWLDRANLLALLGDYDQAQQSCRPVILNLPQLVGATCMAMASGNQAPESAYQSLALALSKYRTFASPEVQSWSLTVLANLAERSNDPETAAAHLKDAINSHPTDRYAVLALGSALLRLGRQDSEYIEAVEPFDRLDDPAVQLRLLALGAAHEGDQQNLARWFEAAHRRGVSADRTFAEYLHWLNRDPERAATVAAQNFESQKGTEDIWLAVITALEADDSERLQHISQWLATSGYQDRRVELLLQQRGVSL